MTNAQSGPDGHAGDAEELREWLDIALGAAGLATWSWEPPAGAFALSGGCLELLGLPAGGPGAPPRRVLARVHPADRDLVARALLRAAEGRGGFDVQFRVPAAGGARWVHAAGRAVRRGARFIGTLRDVSEQLATVDALRTSRDRYHLIARATQDVVWDWDLATGRVEWSDAVLAVFRYRPIDVVPDAAWWEARIHPEDRGRVAAAVEALFAGETDVWSDEYRFERGDGTYAVVYDRGYLERDPGGVPVRMVGSMMDLTEQKRIEGRLREHTRTLETIHRISSALAAELDQQRLVQLLTDEATALCGAQFGAFFYKTTADTGESYMLFTLSGAPREAFSKFPNPRPTEIFGPTFRGEGVVRLDDVTKDPRYGRNAPYHGMPEGHLPVRSYMALPVLSRTGDLLGALFFGHAEAGVFAAWHEQIVTAIAAQAAVALDNARLYRDARNAEERFRRLIENASDIVSIVAADGTITYESPSIERVLGYAADELVGRQAIEFVHPEDAAGVARMFRGHARAGSISSPIEYRFRHKDGSWRTLESIGKNLTADPSVRGMVVNSRDVTERRLAEDALRRSEEQLRQSQKMEAVGRLAGGIAHDFNNLLTIIGGYSAMMLRRLGPADPLYANAEAIEQAAGRAASLTRQLLAFSRGQVLKAKVVDPNAVARGIEEMLRRLIGEDIELVTAFAPGAGLVRVDPGQLEQVIVNLAVNARDAMPDGGTLTIETANVELDERSVSRRAHSAPAGSYVAVAVRDTGCGMDSGTVERIFEPFYTTKEQGKGTGLGLAMVYAIVSRSGGWVEVSSEPGRGSRFAVFLPRVAEGRAEGEAGDPRPAAAGGRETVLVAEDEAGVLGLVGATLRAAGYSVLEARNGAEALEAAARHEGEIHLLVTDVVMPQLGGPELVERLAALRPGLRVLYMSGYADSSAVERAVWEGAAALVPKPFTPDGLAHAVRAALDGPDGAAR